MNTTRAHHRHDPNQPQSFAIFLMTSFNDKITIVSTVSHQRRLRSIISRSKVSVVRSRSPPFWISSRKHFTSTSCSQVFHTNIYVLQDISQTHLSIYLLISLIRSEKTFATSLTSMTFHAIYPILSYFTHWRHDGYIFLLHNEWRSRHMYILNITIICSYYGDAMKEMNRGIRSFFLFTIYTIQQNPPFNLSRFLFLFEILPHSWTTTSQPIDWSVI